MTTHVEAAQVVQTERGSGVECGSCGGKFILNLRLLAKRIADNLGGRVPAAKRACYCPYCGAMNTALYEED